MWDFFKIFLGSFITSFTAVIFGKCILGKEIKLNIFFVILLIVIFTLFLDFLYIMDFKLLRSLVCFLLYTLLFKFSFNLKSVNSLFVSVVYYMFLFSGEILFFILTTVIFKVSGYNIYNMFGGSFFGNLTVSLLCLLLGFLFNKLLKKLVKSNVGNGMIIYWNLILGCLISFLIISFSKNLFDTETFVVLLIIFVFLVVIFISFRQAYKNSELMIKYDKLLEFIKKYEIEIERQRVFRHETKNQLLIIKSKLVDNDNFDSIVDYIDEIIKDNNIIINHSEYSKLRFLPSNGIRGLFYFKVTEAIDKGLSVNINVSKEVEFSCIKDLSPSMFNNLGKIFGIFLDNAIEGAILTEKKEVCIEIYCLDDNVIFIISNTYLRVIKKHSKIISTKGDNRGHGLLLVKTIVNSNNRFINETMVMNDLYIQKLVIKK